VDGEERKLEAKGKGSNTTKFNKQSEYGKTLSSGAREGGELGRGRKQKRSELGIYLSKLFRWGCQKGGSFQIFKIQGKGETTNFSLR